MRPDGADAGNIQSAAFAGSKGSPIDVCDHRAWAVSAVLAGSKLTVTGTFDGMHSAATAAQLHQGVATGVPGAAIQELTVSKAMGGAISGSGDLTASQVEALRKGFL